MATIMPVPKEGKIVLYIKTGTSSTGNPVTISRTFGKVKSDAADENIHAAAVALSQLMKYPLVNINRIDVSDLISFT